jgi:ribose-phosphate pyrophosphokinase
MKLTVNEMEVKTFNFPDGQPHVVVPDTAYYSPVTVKCSIRNSDELMYVILTLCVLAERKNKIKLRIAYLLGARMDRPLGTNQPFTAEIIANMVFPMAREVEIFNIHSSVLLNGYYDEYVKNILPKYQINTIAPYMCKEGVIQEPQYRIVAPDKGSRIWLDEMGLTYARCEKTRDFSTGNLLEFRVIDKDKVKDRDCLIVDDICDGGGTFIGLAKKLKEAGAKSVNLYVSHGIFSKGFTLEGIDKIWTTNSYREKEEYPSNITVLDAF